MKTTLPFSATKYTAEGKSPALMCSSSRFEMSGFVAVSFVFDIKLLRVLSDLVQRAQRQAQSVASVRA